MIIKEIVPDETKLFLVNHYLGIKYTAQYFIHPKHKYLAQDISKLKKFSNKEFGQAIQFAILLIEQFKCKEVDVLKTLKKGDIVDYAYNKVKDTPEIKKLIDGAEVVNLVQDPYTGEFKEPTLH